MLKQKNKANCNIYILHPHNNENSGTFKDVSLPFYSHIVTIPYHELYISMNISLLCYR